MPAVSKSQQRLMGMAYAVAQFNKTNGEKGLDPNSLDSDYKDEIIELSKSMNFKDLEKFAKTKHKDLTETFVTKFNDFIKLI